MAARTAPDATPVVTWPRQAYSLALNSGLEDACKDIVPVSNLGPQDYALAASGWLPPVRRRSLSDPP
ncbi:hypothetical protein ABZT06_42345 [Streptomyces sp. NPDC005483]|uniref:hypothetical protein n=1 Tax=Streptomyces sp. NPDC005483 TaxID=3154882 RepID=UPI0033A748C8